MLPCFGPATDKLYSLIVGLVVVVGPFLVVVVVGLKERYVD